MLKHLGMGSQYIQTIKYLGKSTETWVFQLTDHIQPQTVWV